MNMCHCKICAIVCCDVRAIRKKFWDLYYAILQIKSPLFHSALHCFLFFWALLCIHFFFAQSCFVLVVKWFHCFSNVLSCVTVCMCLWGTRLQAWPCRFKLFNCVQGTWHFKHSNLAILFSLCIYQCQPPPPYTPGSPYTWPTGDMTSIHLAPPLGLFHGGSSLNH